MPSTPLSTLILQQLKRTWEGRKETSPAAQVTRFGGAAEVNIMQSGSSRTSALECCPCSMSCVWSEMRASLCRLGQQQAFQGCGEGQKWCVWVTSRGRTWQTCSRMLISLSLWESQEAALGPSNLACNFQCRSIVYCSPRALPGRRLHCFTTDFLMGTMVSWLASLAHSEIGLLIDSHSTSFTISTNINSIVMIF